MKVARWGFLAGAWLLVLTLLGRSADFAYKQTFLELGPAKIVGTRNVIYQEAGGYLYTNPGAMMGLFLRCLSMQWGTTLLTATLATVLFCGYQRLARQKVWATALRILFWFAMVLAFLYVAVVCVWEWSLAWLGLLLCIRFLPHWTTKGKFTLLALLVAIILFGCHRRNLEWTYRKYESFWASAEQCTTMEHFVKAFGEPAFLRKNISSEAREWFDTLAHCDQSLWLPGKTLAAFLSPQMPDILLLPWFDDEGSRIAFAWCDLTPERKVLLENETDAAPSVEYGTSRLYSRAEMELAVAAVKDDFAQLEGCKLYSLAFAGDERCRRELEYANKDRAQEEQYADCIVFDSVFRSPVAGGGAWEPNELYRWSWILARTRNGAWIVINRGYA